MADTNWMHVFGQLMWHDEIQIVGDTQSLLALKKAVEDALETGSGSSLAFTGDGEGYNILIAREDDKTVYDTLAVPYTDEMASEKNTTAVWPHTLEKMQAAYKKAIAVLENRK